MKPLVQKHRQWIFAASLFCFGFAPPSAAGATMHLCKKTSTGAITLRAGGCVKGETRIRKVSDLTGRTGDSGNNGSDGDPGASGISRIYGDGTAGAMNVSNSTILTGTNLQFTNVTIDAGQTLTITSGTVIRCTGSFVNNGQIAVLSGALGGYTSTTAASTAPLVAPAHPGIAKLGAGGGAFGTNAASVTGGPGGLGLSESEARQMLKLGFTGGGSGGGSGGAAGGDGGGAFAVLCEGGITNNGTIDASGANGGACSGGGAGGVVILASRSLVTNSGTGVIDVRGGNGGDSSASCGVGGGGGAGIVHLISPNTPLNNGSVLVTGGGTGSGAVLTTANPRQGGGGGGACFGIGGNGAQVLANNHFSLQEAGGDSELLTTTVDPSSLF